MCLSAEARSADALVSDKHTPKCHLPFLGGKNNEKGGEFLMEPKCDNKIKFNIPKYEIEALARAFLPAVLNYYRTEEGKRELNSKKQDIYKKSN